MKKTAIHIITIALLITTFISCSTRKDRFLNRAIHSTTTKYNVLYNGNLAFDKAKKELDDKYEDNFFEILPIEPLKIEKKLQMPIGPKSMPSIKDDAATSTATGFARAEEKAIKAVQKHSMNIAGKQKNKQIDDAYFLLGKARYFDQRFVPALETFNYIIKHFPDSPLFNDAMIWEAKCLTRLRNEDFAIDKLKEFLKYKESSEQTKAEALTVLAMAYMEQDSTQMVINLLDSTLLYKTKNFNQKARNLFILGQLYRLQNKIDSSNIAFKKLSKFAKAPYRFKIYSQVEIAKNYNSETDNTEEILANLKKLSKNRDNRPFLDGILYQTGKINLANKKVDTAACHFKKSIKTKFAHVAIQSLAYEDLGNIKFDQTNFLDAGAYYDSVLNITENKNTKRIRRLIRKRKSLDEVIRLENISTRNDSILNLSSLSKDEQTDFFNNYIKELKKEDKEAKIIAQNKKNSTGFGNSLLNTGSKQSAKGSKFYFYNAQTVGFGQAEFKKIWGERKLADNWRLSDKRASAKDKETTNVSNEEIDETQKYDVAYYLEKIPTDEKVLDSITNKRNDAYYNLGLIYKEKFKKDELATTRLEKLLTFLPNEKLVLPSYYHLYKAFESFNMVKSDFYKNKITNDYPESRYAQIIENPDYIAEESSGDNSPEINYKTTYKKYINKEYSETLEDCKKFLLVHSSTDITPKFELLKSYAIAKLRGKEDFIKALTFVVANYPNKEEGIHAKNVIASLNGEVVLEKKSTKNKIKEKPTNKSKQGKVKKKKFNKELPTNEKMLELIKKKKRNLGPPGSGRK